MSAKKNTAVIVVDMQERFMKGMDYLEEGKLVHSNLALLEHCRQNGVPAVALRYTLYGDYNFLVAYALKRIPKSRSFVKTFNDGFTNTRFDEYVSSLGVERLVLTGLNAGFCVQSTAHTALDKGFQIATSRDLIAHNSAQKSLAEAYDWFRAHGTLFDTYHDLLRTL